MQTVGTQISRRSLLRLISACTVSQSLFSWMLGKSGLASPDNLSVYFRQFTSSDYLSCQNDVYFPYVND